MANDIPKEVREQADAAMKGVKDQEWATQEAVTPTEVKPMDTPKSGSGGGGGAEHMKSPDAAGDQRQTGASEPPPERFPTQDVKSDPVAKPLETPSRPRNDDQRSR